MKRIYLPDFYVNVNGHLLISENIDGKNYVHCYISRINGINTVIVADKCNHMFIREFSNENEAMECLEHLVIKDLENFRFV